MLGRALKYSAQAKSIILAYFRMSCQPSRTPAFVLSIITKTSGDAESDVKTRRFGTVADAYKYGWEDILPLVLVHREAKDRARPIVQR